MKKTTLICLLDKPYPPDHSCIPGMLARALRCDGGVRVQLLVMAPAGEVVPPTCYPRAGCLAMVLDFSRSDRSRQWAALVARLLTRVLIEKAQRRGERVELFVRNHPALMLVTASLRYEADGIVFQAIGVRSRLITNSFRPMGMPVLHGLLSCAMADGFLRQTICAQPYIALDLGFVDIAAGERVGAQNLGYPALEAFAHTVGLGRTRQVDIICPGIGGVPIKAELSGRLILPVGGETPCETLGLVGQDRVALERHCFAERLEKAVDRLAAYSRHQLHVDLARGMIDGHAGVAQRLLVAYLRQILDLDVREAELVRFESLTSYGPRLRLFRPLRSSVAPQHPIQCRAAHVRASKEIALDRQGGVQRQAERGAQLQRQRFLPIAEWLVELVEPVQRVTAIHRRLPAASLHDEVPRLAVARRQPVNSAIGLPNRFWRGLGGCRVLVRDQQHPESFFYRARTTARASPPISSGRML